jgi:hypothetical protein
MPPIMGEVLDLAYNDPAVGMIIVDRVISRNIFHLPDLPDPTPETIRVLNGKRHPKPTVFSVDSEGGDPDLARRGADRAAGALVRLHRYHAFRRRAGI